VSEARRDTIRVLLVEDNPGDARLIREALRDVSASPFELTHVDRLSAAFERLDQGDMDVLLLDLSLPDSKGLETVARAREHTSRIPIVVLTGLNDEMTAFLALRKGAQDYLVKDMISGRLLLRVIRYGIERKRIEDALQESEGAARRLAGENAVLAEIGRIISSSLNIDEVYTRFTEEVRKLIPFDRTNINLVDLEKWTFSDAYVMGVDVPARRQRQVVPLSGTYTEEVVRRREGMLYQTESIEEIGARFPGLKPNIEAGLRSFLCVPLISNDQVIGVLHLSSLKPNAYSQSHLVLAESVASQIAGAIANAQLHAERVRVEEALRESERRYRHMIESASEVVYTTDARGRFTYVNPPASILTEYPEDQLIGRYFTELVAPEWKQRVKRFYLKQFAKRVPETSLEFPMVTMSGKVKWVEQSVTLQIEGGNVVGFQAIGRDISKRREIQEEREQLIVELQQALTNVKTLSGLLPICASCKKIRDDKGYWNQIETYIREHSGVDFSHGICPECVKTLYPGLLSQHKTQEEVKK
jgi:PAS domain S-box-containing protein